MYLPNIVNLIGEYDHHGVVGVRAKRLRHAHVFDRNGRRVAVLLVVDALPRLSLADDVVDLEVVLRSEHFDPEVDLVDIEAGSRVFLGLLLLHHLQDLITPLKD